MGQPITVTANRVGKSAIFVLDRSLTGQDGMSYDSPPGESEHPPDILASRLMKDQAVTDVHVLSNTVTVTRASEWDEQGLGRAAAVISNLFVFYPADEDPDQRLREQHYNSTISHIRRHNDELWVIRVRHDDALDPFKAGQYTTLGIGYWEPRVDDVSEDFEADSALRDKMVRRSYSVSSSIVDEQGELLPAHTDDIEFYVVLVRPDAGPEMPGLTPRLFAKDVGDRIYMGRKFTGRYTLDGVTPDDNVVFLSTGTGEAPQNAMAAELLRRGHPGQILSVVCVRHRSDLAYLEQQEVVEEKYPNYRYLALTTREPENEGNKQYIQDLLVSGAIEAALGSPLDPTNTHVFLCGNPSMIGIPEWGEDGAMTFPPQLGVCQILTDRGFTIDRHREPGNLHYEEYW
jgi:ferredoxin/flavodoxin---NADP+ reductase